MGSEGGVGTAVGEGSLGLRPGQGTGSGQGGEGSAGRLRSFPPALLCAAQSLCLRLCVPVFPVCLALDLSPALSLFLRASPVFFWLQPSRFTSPLFHASYVCVPAVVTKVCLCPTHIDPNPGAVRHQAGRQLVEGSALVRRL